MCVHAWESDDPDKRDRSSGREEEEEEEETLTGITWSIQTSLYSQQLHGQPTGMRAKESHGYFDLSSHQ